MKHLCDLEKISSILHEAQTGIWTIEMNPGEPPKMYGNSTMLELLGIRNPEISPEGCYQWWFNRIEAGFIQMIQACVEKAASNQRMEVKYRWVHPEQGRILIRWGGVRDWSHKHGLCLMGYHQNITDTIAVEIPKMMLGFGGQDPEVEKRTNELMAQIAVAQLLYPGAEL